MRWRDEGHGQPGHQPSRKPFFLALDQAVQVVDALMIYLEGYIGHRRVGEGGWARLGGGTLACLPACRGVLCGIPLASQCGAVVSLCLLGVGPSVGAWG